MISLPYLAMHFESIDPNAKLAAIFAPLTDYQGRITYSSTNDEVLEILRADFDAAINNTFNVLKTRIDQFGVAQPNISLQANAGRIIVELPGVDDPDRVRKILQQTAELEFWTTFENEEVIRFFLSANEMLRTLVAVEGDETEATASTQTEVVEETATTNDKENELLDLIGDGGAESEGATDGDLEQFGEANPLFEVLQVSIDESQVPIPGSLVAYVRGRDRAKVDEYLGLEQISAIFQET